MCGAQPWQHNARSSAKKRITTNASAHHIGNLLPDTIYDLLAVAVDNIYAGSGEALLKSNVDGDDLLALRPSSTGAAAEASWGGGRRFAWTAPRKYLQPGGGAGAGASRR